MSDHRSSTSFSHPGADRSMASRTGRLLISALGLASISVSTVSFNPQAAAQTSSILSGKPITIAVRKVKDQANASWWKPSYEEKLADMLSTELTNSGHFTVLERDNAAMDELRKELNMGGVNKKTAPKKNNLTGAKYIIVASLTDFQEAGSKGGGNTIGFGGFGFGKKKETKEFYVSFDLKVINTSTGAIAFSRTIEGSAQEEKSGSAFSGSYGGISMGQNQESETKLPVGRAVRAAMVESSQYLDCVLYKKDECVSEYKAKDEKRKESTKGTLDMF